MITLNLEIQEVNLVLNALATQPFNQVFELIAKIKTQADPQVLPTMETNNAAA